MGVLSRKSGKSRSLKPGGEEQDLFLLAVKPFPWLEHLEKELSFLPRSNLVERLVRQGG